MRFRQHDTMPSFELRAELIREGYLAEPMAEEDIREVGRLERRCFTNPWPASAYRRELRKPERNVYFVLRQIEECTRNGAAPNGVASSLLSKLTRSNVLPAIGLQSKPGLPIVGFAGFWLTFGEAHITTIAVKPELQRRHLGELLLQLLFDQAANRGADFLSLEVRESNMGAIRLYTKYGFRSKGIRHGYYTDDGEDALVMRSHRLVDQDFQSLLKQRQHQLTDHFRQTGISVDVGRLRLPVDIGAADAS